MPYIVSLWKKVQIADSDIYFNECCIGGDVVLDRLLPVLQQRYGEDIESNQEDWGWFAWFEDAGTRLAVDVYTDDPKDGAFRVHLTSSRTRFLLGAKIEDCPELERLRELVLERLKSWPVSRINVERVDEKYMPV